MVYRYAGKILYVNLTTREYWTKDLDVDYVRPIVSGAGLGIRILTQRLIPSLLRIRLSSQWGR